ncbi:MAG TPA: DUF2752 domain-containing protein [Pyrinomonadaceae bacterium]
MSNELSNLRLIVVATWLGLAATGAYLFIFEPGKTGFFPICLFRALTGLLCPGCGATRAMHQLLHGHFLEAFELNPLLLIGLPFLFVALVRYSILAVRGITPRKNILPASIIYALFFIIVSFWIIRNTSVYPFES